MEITGRNYALPPNVSKNVESTMPNTTNGIIPNFYEIQHSVSYHVVEDSDRTDLSKSYS